MSDLRDAAPSTRPLGDLGVRAASGLVLIAVAVVTTLRGGDLFVLVWLAAAVAILWEWQRLVEGDARGIRLAVCGAALVIAAATARSALSESIAILVAAAAVSAALVGPGARLWAAGGVLYAGLFLLAVIALRFSFPFGGVAIIWLFATVWSTDIFAYFGGRLIGGPKLWPRISPSKTWSGTLTGVLAGAVIGTLAAMSYLTSSQSLVPVLILTALVSIVSQAGDAGESAMKRRFGVKDSSRLIPGHGGVMDRLDGFVAAAIFALVFGLARGLPSVAGGLFYWA